MPVRAGEPRDLYGLLSLAALTGPGFTSPPECQRVPGDQLALSQESFAGRVDCNDARYTLILQDSDGMVVGVAAVIGAVGRDHPHLSYRVDGTDAGLSLPDRRVLTPVAMCRDGARSDPCSFTRRGGAAAPGRCWRERATC